VFHLSQRRSLRWVPLLAAVACVVAGSARHSRADEPIAPSALLDSLRRFREMGSVLYIAAHPDDENNALIAYFARGRNFRTAYLSLTRGDGGQNLIGPEFFEQLGVVRTHELLAARKLDGGRQFFTRAIDFGFSKGPTETLRIWDRQQVLADMVRVVRIFRPDVLITRFSPRGGGHGHHTASAILAVEAFPLAGDSRAFPEQLKELTPWQPKRIFENEGGPGVDENAAKPSAGVVRIEIGDKRTAAGEPLAAIAARSRSMHRSQGFGDPAASRDGGGAHTESFRLLGGELAVHDLFDGIDATWGRVPGGGEIGTQADAIIARFDPKDPAASAPALLDLRRRLATLPGDDVMGEKRLLLDRILQGCLGLEVATLVRQAEVVPGEMLAMTHVATVRSGVPVRWLTVRYPAIHRETGDPIALRPNQPASRESRQTLPAATPLSQPYWLREPHTTGLFRVDEPALIGRPEGPPAFPVEQVFEVGGQTLVVSDEPALVNANGAGAEVRRRLEVVAPVSLRFLSDVRLVLPGSRNTVIVEVSGSRAGAAGTLALEVPPAWRVEPAAQAFRLEAAGDRAELTFTVAAPARPATAAISARARIGGTSFGNQRIVIRHDHIPLQPLQPAARQKLVALDLAIRGQRVGYVPGAGDRVAEGLEVMGYAVTRLTGADLTPERLSGLDAVVIGVRAFNIRDDLAARLPALFAYVESGGTVVVQYQRPDGLKMSDFAPYRLRLSQARVTDENATVRFLAADHPALTTPNTITAADFDGWVQERGIYFPDQWDDHFTPILAFHDPGEAPLAGGLLIANHGRGHFVYTSLVFFRQLPAGIPGAYRLFANLVSLGKS
jgi:LmbE family N-acetylglucosaminyl deacetylase